MEGLAHVPDPRDDPVERGVGDTSPLQVFQREDSFAARSYGQTHVLCVVVDLHDQRPPQLRVGAWSLLVLRSELREELRPLVAGNVADRSPVARAPIVGAKSRSHRVVRVALPLGVERGPHLEPACEHCVGAVALHEVASHLFDEVGSGDRGLAAFRLVELEPPRQGRRPLGGADEAVLLHATEHEALALEGFLAAVSRRVLRRCWYQASDQCAFGQRELARRLRKVRMRRCFDPVSTGAQVDLVQVQIEDLVLVQCSLDSHGQDHVLELADVAAIRAQEKRLRHLLRDRAAALAHLPRQQVCDRGAQGSPRSRGLRARRRSCPPRR